MVKEVIKVVNVVVVVNVVKVARIIFIRLRNRSNRVKGR